MNRLLLLLSLLLFSCSQSPLSGNGTGTDIGEAKVYGYARFRDYSTADNVYVTIREQGYIPFSIPAKNQIGTVSGKDGTFTINHISQGYYLVELRAQDSLCAIKRFYISTIDTIVNIGDIILDTSATYIGTVLNDEKPAAGADLLVLGMDQKITLNENGLFTLLLPPGEQLFRIITPDQNIHNDVPFNTQQSGQTIRTFDVPTTIFDDFDDFDGCNNLSKILGGGGWFAFTDNSDGGSSTIIPTSSPGLIAAIDTSSEAYQGGSLHCIFSIDMTFTNPYALIGCDISSSKAANSSKSWFDFSKMTAITFMAKGSDTIYLQLTCKPIIAPYVYTVYEIPVVLSTQWQKHTILPSDIPNALQSTETQAVSWKNGCTAVSNINFITNKQTDLWLDDIKIEGIGLADFLK
ncbi:MAG TPA: hypothetical protein VHO70_23490 [Chitinispirillaceae bacterium]|nr:hypothetical protein [Chitinispirillaceae bacterium]